MPCSYCHQTGHNIKTCIQPKILSFMNPRLLECRLTETFVEDTFPFGLNCLMPPPKKSVRFSEEEDKVEYFDALRSDNIGPKRADFVEGDVPLAPYRAPYRWADDAVDCEIYATNTKINTLDPKINDSAARNAISVLTPFAVKQEKVKNWHLKGPDPMRYLTGHLLVTETINEDLEGLDTCSIKGVYENIIEIVSSLIKEEIVVFQLYEAGLKIYRQNVGILQSRNKIIGDFLIQRRKKEAAAVAAEAQAAVVVAVAEEAAAAEEEAAALAEALASRTPEESYKSDEEYQILLKEILEEYGSDEESEEDSLYD
jgi:hypothetical protein